MERLKAKLQIKVDLYLIKKNNECEVNSMKKVLAFILACVMSIVFVGCSGSKTNRNDAESKVVFYFMGDPDKLDNDEVYAAANEILKKKYGIEVIFNPISMSAYNDKMNLVMASGEYYDVCWTSNWSNDYTTNAASGAYLPLDDALSKEMIDVKGIFNDDIWDAVRVNQKIYGVPIQQIFAYTGGVMIPSEYYDEYSHFITDNSITKLSDYTPYIEAVSKLAPKQANISFNFDNMLTTYGWEIIPGVGIAAVTYEGDKNSVEVFNIYETDEFREGVETRKAWTEKGYTIDGLIVGQQGGESPAKTPIIFQLYKPGVEIMNKPSGFSVEAIPLTKSYLSTAGILGTLYSISANSKNVEGSMKLIEALNTDAEIANLLTYGIEGKHYNKISENVIDVVENPGYSNHNWCVGNVFNLYVTDEFEPTIWEDTKKMNDEAIPSRILGFSVDINPIAVELNNCNTVLNEYLSIVQSGVGDTSAALDEMLKKLKQAGSDKVIAEVQKQINEWLKAN